MTWEWFSTWWRIYGQEFRLFIVAASTEKDGLVGLAPLFLHRRKLMFIGDNIACPDHLDFLVDRYHDEHHVLLSILAHLRKVSWRWHVLDLHSLDRRSELINLCAANFKKGFSLKKGEICPFVELPDSWEMYRYQINKKARNNLSRHLTRLKQDCQSVSFGQAQTPTEVSSVLYSLEKLHRKSWVARGQEGVFDARFTAFHRTFSPLALENNWLRLYSLVVDGQTIGVLYCFRYGKTFYAYQSGYDPAWLYHNPGRLLLGYAIKCAIEEGALEFDMLRGTESYKYKWTKKDREDVNLRVKTSSPLGKLEEVARKLYRYCRTS